MPTKNMDHIALIGKNRKMMITDIESIPTIKKGQGVALQKYKNSSLSDAKLFNYNDGLEYTTAQNETIVDTKIGFYKMQRGAVGKIPPKLFNLENKF
jgi:topoisomerase-4 subunit A